MNDKIVMSSYGLYYNAGQGSLVDIQGITHAWWRGENVTASLFVIFVDLYQLHLMKLKYAWAVLLPGNYSAM